MDAEWVWTGLYQTIARCNGAIANIDTYDSPSNQNQIIFNDVAGHAYFVRAGYFTLVRLLNILYGLNYLHLEILIKLSHLHQIYEQVISDATTASQLLNGNAGLGYPKSDAANMLLSKVYMTIATNSELQSDGSSMNIGQKLTTKRKGLRKLFISK